MVSFLYKRVMEGLRVGKVQDSRGCETESNNLALTMFTRDIQYAASAEVLVLNCKI